jgi:excisionase family DNA binding protein
MIKSEMHRGPIGIQQVHGPVCQPRQILVTKQDAARLLSVSERTLFDLLVPRGPIPCFRIPGGRTLRIRVQDLERWAEHMVGQQLDQEKLAAGVSLSSRPSFDTVQTRNEANAS